MKPLEFDGPPLAFFTFDNKLYTYVVYGVATKEDNPGQLLPYLMNFYKTNEGSIIVWRRRPEWNKAEDGVGWRLTWRCAIIPSTPNLDKFIAPIKPEGEPTQIV